MKGQGTLGKGQVKEGNAKDGEIFRRKAVIGLESVLAFIVGLSVFGITTLAFFFRVMYSRQIATLQEEVKQLRERVRELERQVETHETIVTSSERADEANSGGKAM